MAEIFGQISQKRSQECPLQKNKARTIKNFCQKFRKKGWKIFVQLFRENHFIVCMFLIVFMGNEQNMSSYREFYFA
jgi:hypothetical protein